MSDKSSSPNEKSATIEASRQHRMNPERFRLIFDSSHLGIVTTDLSGKFLDANPAFCRMLGYTLEEFLQLNIATITHPDDLPGNLQARKGVIAGLEGSEIFEKRYITKAGDVVWARLVGSPMHDNDSRIIGLFAMVEDISERKRSEDQLRRMQAEVAASEIRLRHITKASLDLIWDWDLVNNQLWWGEGLQALFGFEQEMMGTDEKFWLRRAHRDDRQKMIDAYQSVMSGSAEGWHIMLRIRKMDGSYTQVEERAFAVRGAQGEVLRIVGGVTDISARLELEEKLRQSQRLEAVGQLTGGIAHDFNNLLTVILGNAELLGARLAGDAELQELAEAISRSALQGADLTHRMLAFARRQPLQPKNVNLNNLVDNMARILERTLGEEIDLDLCPDSSLWLCEVDPAQMESAILNLCINARDAMPGGGKLVIETRNALLEQNYTDRVVDLEPGEYVCLAISDTGVGIAPENLERVLEPFFTTKPKDKGTGLGLSTIFGFVKQSGGHLSIYSELGQGTTVRIYLPRTLPGAVEDQPASKDQARLLTGNETILLVEDDPRVLMYAETQLRSLGYHVLTSSNGREALEVIRERNDVDLLFTDVVMPGGMGGRQLAEAAQALRPDLKVLYTSGYTENSILHNGRLDPGVHLLGKPYQRHELASKLREILDAS